MPTPGEIRLAALSATLAALLAWWHVESRRDWAQR